jgi:hypothetical protein
MGRRMLGSIFLGELWWVVGGLKERGRGEWKFERMWLSGGS